jgi:hypothetical protein
VSDTPRTDEQINGKPCTRFEMLAGDSLRNASVPSEFARWLERELNAANAIIRQQQLLDEENLRLKERIKRLEEALAWYEYTVLNCYCHGSEGDAARDALRKDQGRKAKEAKL